MTGPSQPLLTDRIPYPSSPVMKALMRSPILLHRLGLGFIIGRLFMILTTTGRKSGKPRRTAIEFHEFKGRIYLLSNWGVNADWYRNIQADPFVTIQTWRGTRSMQARRITADAELALAYEFAMSNPSVRTILRSIGFAMTLEEFLAQRERFVFVTFDPTDLQTPPALKADLWWIWLLLLPLCSLLVWIVKAW